MAGEEVDYGSARITLELDDADAERQSRDIGATIQRTLTQATRNLGRTVRDNISRGLRDVSVAATVEPDLTRFERTLRNGLRGIRNLQVEVAPDLRQFRRALTRRGAIEAVDLPVKPDTSGFPQELRRALRRVRAEVQLRADSRALVREIERELRRVRAPRISVEADVDVSRIQGRLRSLDIPRIDATVVLDVDRIEAQLRELAQRQITIPIRLGEPDGGGGGGAGDVGEGLLSNLRNTLSGAGSIGAGFGAEALAGIRSGLLAAGPWGAVAAGVAAYAAVVGKVLMTGIEGVIEHQQITGTLRAALGLGTKDANQAGRAVGELYARGVVDSVEEGTSAVQAALRNGLAIPSDVDGLEDISTKISDVGRLMEEDVGKVARSVGTMVKTGLVDNAAEGLDLLTKSVQQGGNVAEDVLDTFTEYPTQFRQLGLSGKEAFGLIQQGIEGGARDSDVIADALKEFSIEAAQGGKRVTDAFKAAHLDADKLTAAFAKGGPAARDALQEVFDKLQSIKDPLKRNQVAVGLFGTKAEDLAGALSNLDLRTAAKEMDGFGGAADRAGDALRDNLGTKLQTIGREIKQAFQGAFTGDFSQFGDVKTAIEEALPDLKETGAHIAQSIQQGIVQYGPKIFEAVFKLASELGERVDIWGPLLLKILAGASAMTTVIAALIVTAIGGALKGLGSKLLPYLEGAWDAVAGFFTDTIPGLAGDLGSGVADLFTGAFEGAGDAVSSGIDSVVGFFTGIGGRIAEGASSVTDAVTGFFVDAFVSAREAVSAGIDSVVDFFVQLPGRIVAGLAALPGLLVDAFTSAVAFAVIGILTAIAGVVFIFTDLPVMIYDALIGLGTYLVAAFTSGWALLTAWLVSAGTQILAWFTALPGQIYNALIGFGTFLLAAFVTGFAIVNARVSGWIASTVAFFQGLPGRVGAALSALGSFLLSNFVSAFNTTRARVTSWALQTVAFFRGLPGRIASALSGLGGRIAAAFSSATGRARSAVTGLINGLVNLFRTLPSRITGALGNIGSQIVSKIKSGLPSAVRKYLPFADGGIVLGPTHALIGEAGPEVVIPLSRPRRAQQLAQDSGLVDMLTRAGVLGGRPGGGDDKSGPRTVHNHTWNLYEVGDANMTAHRVINRLTTAAVI